MIRPGVEVRRQVVSGVLRGYHLATAKPPRRSSGGVLEAIGREQRQPGLNSALRAGWLALLVANREKSRPACSGPGVGAGAGLANGAGELAGFAQSRPNPRGGSMFSSAPRSSMQIASSLCARTDSARCALWRSR